MIYDGDIVGIIAMLYMIILTFGNGRYFVDILKCADCYSKNHTFGPIKNIGTFNIVIVVRTFMAGSACDHCYCSCIAGPGPTPSTSDAIIVSTPKSWFCTSSKRY